MASPAAQPLTGTANIDTGGRKTYWEDFTQQRLKAYTPFLTPQCTIGLYMLGGAVFLALGGFLLILSRGVVEHTLDYTSVALNTVGELPLEAESSEMELHIDQDMEPPIWVYYQLDSFHQNHRRYVKSRDDYQLQASEPVRTTRSDLKNCDPAVMESDSDRPLYPCGLVARSVFNDTFAIIKKRVGEDWKQVEVDNSAKKIAWQADIDSGKFTNYDPEAKTDGIEHKKLMDMWILKNFPPVKCVQKGLSDKKKLQIVRVREEEVNYKNSKVKIPACRNYKTDDAKCDFVDEKGEAFNCDAIERVPDWGVESGHFMVWMRVAGLPTFRKLWGRIDEKLEAGTKMKFYVASHFPVNSFGGKKKLVISTSSALGGRNEFLGYSYILVGICCIIFGTWFLGKHLSSGSQSQAS